MAYKATEREIDRRRVRKDLGELVRLNAAMRRLLRPGPRQGTLELRPGCSEKFSRLDVRFWNLSGRLERRLFPQGILGPTGGRRGALLRRCRRARS